MRATLAGLSLRDIEYAVAVGSTLHFGRAAQACGVSQPALSEQLRKLEDLLGVRLFERGHAGVRVTPRGAELLRQAGRVAAEARGLLELARTVSAPLTGQLHLGAISTLGPYLPHVLLHAREAFPRLQLRLTEGQTATLLDGLRNGDLDAALIATAEPADWLDDAELFFEPFHLVCPVAHRLADLPDVTLQDLAGDDLMLLEDGHCLRDQALALCQSTSGQSRHATGLETLWHMIAAGEGYSLLPALSLTGRTAMRDLVVTRDLDDPAAGRAVRLVWRSTDPRGSDFLVLARSLRDAAPAGVAVIGETQSFPASHRPPAL
jgi:LysR family hydrogen peroxide-inducible transcriptional activator